MNFQIKRVLVLSPHVDDGEIGAGGTIARFTEEKVEIFYVAFSLAEKSIPEPYPKDILQAECKQASRELDIPESNIFLHNFPVRFFPQYRQDILEELVKINRELHPNLVICPSSNDVHQDHVIIQNETVRAFKKNASIWGYEHPWNNLSFTTDIFVRLEERHIKKKIKAMKAYSSQSFRSYFDENYIEALAHTRGVQVDLRFAEAFELLRFLIP